MKYGLFVIATLTAFFTGSVSLGTIRNARTGATYTTLQSAINDASSGDTIEINGTYTQPDNNWADSPIFCGISKDLTIRGAGPTRAVLDANGYCPGDVAILQWSSSNLTLENLEMRNCRGSKDGNGAAVRLAGTNLTIRNCYIHDCEDGIMGNPPKGHDGTGTVLVENSEFSHCGFGDSGYTHNIYVGTYGTFIMRYSWSHNTYRGHLVKTRAYNNYITYNRICDEALNPEGRDAELRDRRAPGRADLYHGQPGPAEFQRR